MAKTIAKKTSKAIPMGKSIVRRVVRKKVETDNSPMYQLEDDDSNFSINEVGTSFHDSDPILSAYSNELDSCCGMVELSDLYSKISKGSRNWPTFKAFALSALKKFVANETNADSCRTIMVVTNGIGASVTWEELLGDSGVFVAVKEFKNSNSRNMLKVWLSTN